jgi:hypothetical protein
MGRCAYLLKKCADRRAESKIWACESFCRQDFLHLILRSVGLVFWIFARPQYAKDIVQML